MQANNPLVQTLSSGGRVPWIPLLAGLLVVQMIAVGLVYWPGQTTAAPDTPLLPDVTAENVDGITVTDAEQESLELVMEDGTWVVAGTDGFPVREERVTSLLEKLTALRTDRLVASSAASHAQLQVADGAYARRMDLELAGGDRATLFVGTSPRARATHVRAGGDDAVYLASDLSAFDATPQVSSWIDTVYFQLPREQIARLSLSNANGEVTFSKDESGAWQMAGLGEDETLAENNLQSLLTTLSSLPMAAPVGKTVRPEYGLDQPTATVTVVSQNQEGGEETHILTIGSQDVEANQYYLSSSDSPYVVKVAGFSVDRFLQRGRADFVATPEPEPATGEGPATTP